jgi:putative ABC transport system substrate-binding protein
MDRVQRRAFLLAAGALAAAPFVVDAQQAAKVPRIGYMALDLASNPRGMDSFRQRLRELGYEEGRSIVIEIRDAERRFDRFPALAAELVALEVDVIVAPSVLASQAASQATTTIPIVFAGVADPVSDGLVASFARPGGNVTGLSNLTPQLVGKRLELLKEALPGIRRVAILWQPGSGMERTDREALKDAELIARALALELTLVEARVAADLPVAFSAMAKRHVNAFVVLGTPLFFIERQQLADLSAELRLPGIFSTRQFVDAGGFMAYGASLDHLLGRSAEYVDKLLKGARAADLPVEQPTKFEFTINLRTARMLGMAIPPALLRRADHVVA